MSSRYFGNSIKNLHVGGFNTSFVYFNGADVLRARYFPHEVAIHTVRSRNTRAAHMHDRHCSIINHTDSYGNSRLQVCQTNLRVEEANLRNLDLAPH